MYVENCNINTGACKPMKCTRGMYKYMYFAVLWVYLYVDKGKMILNFFCKSNSFMLLWIVIGILRQNTKNFLCCNFVFSFF
jgi:hypothetical protein